MGAALEVGARPQSGGADVPLGVLEPGNPFREAQVSLAGLSGRTVRIVLDPVAANGRAVDVAAVGPVTAPLPGWTVLRGVPRPMRRGARAALVVREEPPGWPRRGSGAGRPRARCSWPCGARDGCGGRRRGAGHRGRGPRVAGRARAAAAARRHGSADHPGLARRRTLELRDLGLVVRATGAAALRARRAGRGRVVTGRLVPAAAALRVELRSARGRRLAAVRTDANGRFRMRAPAAGALVVSTPGDRTRLPGRWRVPG